MRKTSSSRRVGLAAPLGLFALAAVAASCSLINSFDDLKEGSGGGGGGATTSTTTSPATSSSTSPMTSSSSTGTGGASTTATGGGGSATTTTTSSTGTGGAGGGVVAARGLLVVSAENGTQFQLSAIDPATGDELPHARDVAISAVGMAYDPETSLWYIFDGPTVPPSATDTITLHAGTIDDVTGLFTEVAQVSPVPVLRDSSTIGVLKGRIIYRAYDATNDAGSGLALAIVDTSHVMDATPKLVANPMSWSGYTSLPAFDGILATPATGASAQGGQVTVLTSDCTVSPCSVTRTPVIAPSTYENTVSVQSPVFAASALQGITPVPEVWVSQRNGGTDYDVLAFLDPAGVASTIRRFDTNGNSPADVSFTLTNAQQYFGSAMADCAGDMLLTEFHTKQIVAVSLATGAFGTASLGSDSATVITFDEVTQRAFMPFPASTSVDAFQLGGTPTAPTIQKLDVPNWTSPTFKVKIAVARSLSNFGMCP
jgi:hypothetical protein